MDEKPKNKKGRPTIYCPEIVERILFLVATEPCGLKQLCERFPELPNHDTIKEWRYKYEDFSARYAKSKAMQVEFMAEDIHDIVNDVEPYFDEHGNKRIDSGTVQWRRLQADTLKWQATKLVPKLYGERQQVQTSVTVKHEDAITDLE